MILRPVSRALVSNASRKLLAYHAKTTPARWIARTQPRTQFHAMMMMSGTASAPPNPQIYTKGDISTSRYNELADKAMYTLLESLEELVESDMAEDSWEVDYSSGVLTLRLGDHGTYVINKQPPNMQIWLSSPTSGPKRYDYSEDEGGVWYYARDGRKLEALLKEELAPIFGQDDVDVRL
ncbi:Mitochondrial chaperone Frataxin [Tulasnella sp. JGI-2019a]|nr:Mitochondrial chaperone Frataxin [Tulasnella sp. JGI-2019a]KAG9005799.1 Mitochondrial chaperone Frataxin [Tulasnella sp. JGI-2019a]KAG9032286.1 Mitochondrial chaperone Frataxin [Tulasnella sp. JGI-2019a]